MIKKLQTLMMNFNVLDILSGSVALFAISGVLIWFYLATSEMIKKEARAIREGGALVFIEKAVQRKRAINTHEKVRLPGETIERSRERQNQQRPSSKVEGKVFGKEIEGYIRGSELQMARLSNQIERALKEAHAVLKNDYRRRNETIELTLVFVGNDEA
jgi:hypothetical protein